MLSCRKGSTFPRACRGEKGLRYRPFFFHVLGIWGCSRLVFASGQHTEDSHEREILPRVKAGISPWPIGGG